MTRRRPSALLTMLYTAPFAFGGPPVGAQSSVDDPDSIDIVRRAKHAQRDFENIRRIHLPIENNGGGHPCDERVGRYCYWYEPSADPTPPEPEAVRRTREALLQTLAAARERLPGDDWITGQLTRYLAERGATDSVIADSAIATARQCQATRWWCGTLEGLARHLARDYEGADTTFERALRAMPEAERCAWTDLTLLLGEDRRRYRSLSCAERQPVNARIWWLARPLYSRPGNDLKTEHYARQTMARLLENSELAEGVRWDTDLYELTVRFGWPRHWSQLPDRPGRLEPPAIIGHEPSPSFWLLPSPALIEPWADVTDVQWDPALARPPARYAPPYATAFAPIERVQFARFRRGDTTLTVAAFDLPLDTVTPPVDVRLAVAPDSAAPVVVERASPSTSRGALVVRSAWRPAVLSLEVARVDTPWVARRRVLTAPDPGGMPPTMSDILFFTPGEVLPDTLEAVIPSALYAPVAAQGQRVGLYWEMYDALDTTTPREITVTVTKSQAPRDAPYPVGRPGCPLPVKSVTLRWSEEPGAHRGAARAVVLELRSLPQGRYVVAIQMSAAGQPRGCSSRDLWVTAR